MVDGYLTGPHGNNQFIRPLNDEIVRVQESEEHLAFWEIKTSRKMGVIPVDGKKAGAWDGVDLVSTHQWVATIFRNTVQLHHVTLDTRTNLPVMKACKTLDLGSSSCAPQAVQCTFRLTARGWWS